jgi:hypothetical protein
LRVVSCQLSVVSGQWARVAARRRGQVNARIRACLYWRGSVPAPFYLWRGMEGSGCCQRTQNAPLLSVCFVDCLLFLKLRYPINLIPDFGKKLIGAQSRRMIVDSRGDHQFVGASLLD